MEYTLNGKVSLDDYIRFNKIHGKHGFALILKLVVYPLLLVFVAVSMIPYAELIKDIYRVYPLELVKIFFPLIFVVIFLILFHTVGIRLIYKKHYNANKNLRYSQHITINEQRIAITGECGSSILTRENINKIYYDKDSIYIYLGLNIAHIIKKRFLENEDDFGEVVEFVKANFGKK